MKKSELVIGNDYAYSRTRDTLPSYVTKAKLISLDSEGGWRSKSGTVLVEFTYRYGSSTEEYTKREYVQLYTLKGDYDKVVMNIELRKRDMQISSLKGEIEKNRRVGVQNQYKKAFIEFGIPSYTFRDYRPDFTIAFTEEQFKTVSRLLETHNKDVAEAQAHAKESQQLSHLIGSN
jgi:uncharacterized membrane-anchored protein